jgi:hypothetical protein
MAAMGDAGAIGHDGGREAEAEGGFGQDVAGVVFE